MSKIQPVRGVILAHGGMARGMLDAVARISGVGEDSLIAVSNEGKAPETLRAEVADLLGEGPVILFTDLPGGSCAVAAQFCCRDERDVAVVFGVNLPILLDFVYHRDLPLEELVPRLLEKGRGGVLSFPDYSSDANRTHKS